MTSPAVVLQGASQVLNGVGVRRCYRLRQHLLTSSPHGRCGLVNRGFLLMNGGVGAHDELLHNLISATHDIMELRKLSVAFILERSEL